MPSNLRLITLILVLMLAVVACDTESATPPTSTQGATAEPDSTEIRLAINSWLSSELNVQVAKIILEEELDYDVELVAADQFEQWDSLASGEIHAVLELWNSGHVDYKTEYIEENQTVEFAGELGVVGKIGWYIPSYLLRGYPELETWEGFTADNAAIFGTDETGDAGRFLAGAESWSQHDEQIIENLDLNLQVVRPEGDDAEAAMIADLDAAYSEEEPTLFYFWTPHWVFAKYDLEQVRLPEYSDECYSDEAEIACDYPADLLFKVVWVGLQDYAPEAYQFLQNFSYANTDQIVMMAGVELDGKTTEQAARDWVQNNEDTWREWLP
jgi:glycine betaine/proline transport system substrate-binding protein